MCKQIVENWMEYSKHCALKTVGTHTSLKTKITNSKVLKNFPLKKAWVGIKSITQWELKLYKGFILKFYAYLYNVSSCEGTFKNKVLIFNRETLYSEIDWNEIEKGNMFTTSKLGNVFLFVEEMCYEQRKKIVLVKNI